jgi:hypothetical protein
MMLLLRREVIEREPLVIGVSGNKKAFGRKAKRDQGQFIEPIARRCQAREFTDVTGLCH